MSLKFRSAMAVVHSREASAPTGAEWRTRSAFDRCVPQRQDGSIIADGRNVELHTAATNSTMQVDEAGHVVGWLNAKDWIGWKLLVHQPGTFDVRVKFSGKGTPHVRHEHNLTLSLGGKTVRFTTYRLSASNDIGRIHVPNAGIYSLALLADEISPETPSGIRIASVILRLLPVSEEG